MQHALVLTLIFPLLAHFCSPDNILRLYPLVLRVAILDRLPDAVQRWGSLNLAGLPA